MSLVVALQMDPIDSIDINGDSSFALALEAQDRGHKLFHYLPESLSFKDREISARAQELTVRSMQGDHFTLGEFGKIDIKDDLDVILGTRLSHCRVIVSF